MRKCKITNHSFWKTRNSISSKAMTLLEVERNKQELRQAEKKCKKNNNEYNDI